MLTSEEIQAGNALRDRVRDALTPDEQTRSRWHWDLLYQRLKNKDLVPTRERTQRIRLVMLERLAAGEPPEQAAAAAEAKAVALAAA